MSRVKHIAMDTVQTVQLVFTNVQLIISTETNPSQATAVTASVEYPTGTLTQVLFSGIAQGNIPIGGVLVSDPVTLPTSLVRGVPFYTRTWQNAQGGMLFNSTMGTNSITGAQNVSGEFMAYGVTTSDLTMSVTVPNNGGSIYSLYGPAAIIGMTTRPTFLLTGDSRVQGSRSSGNGEIFPNQFGATGYMERALSKRFGCMPLGLGSEMASVAAGAGYVARANFTQYCNTVICEYGINDVSGAIPAATILASLSSFAAKFPEKPVFQTTLEPMTTSTDNWATTTNQTTNVNNSIRVTLNNMIRNGLPPPFSGYVEIADMLESSRDSGLWKASTRTATDLAISSGTTTVTSTSQMQFTSADVGNAILITGAGVAGALLTTYITSVTNATTAVLYQPAGTTVGPSGVGCIPYTVDGIHSTKPGNVQIENSTAFDVVLGLS
jgi:hypothetical protein